jgi:F-type H+-transporting ATPase subunit delta
MSALRLVSSVARRAPGSLVLGRRGYAEVSDKIKLSLVLPHQVRLHDIPISLLSCPSITPMRLVGHLHLDRCCAGQPVSSHR